MTLFATEDLTFTDVRHLPIVKQFAKQIGLVDTVDAIVDTQMELSPGVTVLVMILDSLSGRSPLYRLKEFFHEQDTERLLGVDVPAESFCDHNLGRVMDKIYETGTQKIFSAIAINAVDAFGVAPRKVNFDTFSISVWGDYDVGLTSPIQWHKIWSFKITIKRGHYYDYGQYCRGETGFQPADSAQPWGR